jgi:hypothetical protein
MLKFSHHMITNAIDLVENDQHVFAFSPNFKLYFKYLMRNRGNEIVQLFDNEYQKIVNESDLFIGQEYIDILNKFRETGSVD